MMIKCLIVLLAFVVALSESAISETDRTTIIDKLNEIRGNAGGSDIRKLMFDAGVTAATANSAGCTKTFETGKDWIIQANNLAAALTKLDEASTGLLTLGKEQYDTTSACGGANDKNCKVYREVVNAKSNKVNCDHKSCSADGTAFQVIKCVFDPEYSGSGDAFTKGEACDACGTGYKCCPDNAKLCCVDPDAKSIPDTGKGGSGVSQLTQNVFLVGLAILCSMLFI